MAKREKRRDKLFLQIRNAIAAIISLWINIMERGIHLHVDYMFIIMVAAK